MANTELAKLTPEETIALQSAKIEKLEKKVKRLTAKLEGSEALERERYAALEHIMNEASNAIGRDLCEW